MKLRTFFSDKRGEKNDAHKTDDYNDFSSGMSENVSGF